MPDTDFKLGTYAGGVGAMLYVENITNIVAVEGGVYPYVEWKNASQAVTLGNGVTRWVGPQSQVWRFGALTKAQRDALTAYCPNGSAQVYIRTLKTDSTYANFEAVMTWPQEEPKQEGTLTNLLDQDVEVLMTFLVEQV